MRITDVDPKFIFEGENPQYAQLQQLLSTAHEPWEINQIKWRIENLRSAEALAGEPGAGNGAPVDSRGNLIPVLPTKEWMAKNPSIVKTLPNDALPPNMQKPGMMDKIKGALGLEETGEQVFKSPNENFASITQAPDGTFTITYHRENIVHTGTPNAGQIDPPHTGIPTYQQAYDIAKKDYDLETQFATMPPSIQVQESLDRIKYLSKVLRG